MEHTYTLTIRTDLDEGDLDELVEWEIGELANRVARHTTDYELEAVKNVDSHVVPVARFSFADEEAV